MQLQSNSVITNSTGPHKSVCYNCEIVMTVKVYVVNVHLDIPGKIQTREYLKLTLYPKSSGWGSTKLLMQICMNFCNFMP